MQVVCCQVNSVWEDKLATHARVTSLLDSLSPLPGALVVLPEMFATGFSFDLSKTAEDDERLSENFLAHTARSLGVTILGGVTTRGTGELGRNEAVVFDPDGREVARYCKRHPFSLGGENKHFEAGNDTVVFSCQDFHIVPLVCYDLRFPEDFRQAARQNVHLFVVIANWPEARIDHWVTLLRARAIENQAYVVGVNRCGADPNLVYSGHSLIIDPYGNVLAEAGEDECVIRAELDLQNLLNYRQKFPALADM